VLKRILKEPLLHFAVVGLLLFFYLSKNDPVTKPEIVISWAKIQQITAQFAKTRQRPPSSLELQALIDNLVKEELSFRQGEDMGLIENDPIIKRRVQQKIEFMLNDSFGSLEPSPEDLQTYLDKHQEKYMIEPVYSFKHIYINPEKHDDLDGYLTQLRSKDLDAIYQDSGDSIMLESKYESISTDQVARLFGRKFVESMNALAIQQWLGPVKSGFGVHLLLIENKQPRHLATLDEVDFEIKLDYRLELQKKAINAFYAELLKKYNLIIETGEPAG